MAALSLESMPIEILTYTIATYLPATDFFNLRLTNKHMEAQLFKAFATEFFAKRQFMLSSKSLETLVAISNHAALSPFLTHLVIGLDHPEKTHLHTSSSTFDNLAFLMASQDAKMVTVSGSACNYLRVAFDNLVNLHTIGIRDYNARGRRGSTSWRSYGAPTFEQDTGLRMNHDTSHAGRVFAIVISALSHSTRKQVPRLEIILRRRFEEGVGDGHFFVTDFANQTLQGLRVLLLVVHPGPHDPTALYAITRPNLRCKHLLNFLSRCTNLEHLRLNFHPSETHGRTDQFFDAVLPAWELSPPPLLSQLDLGMCTLDINTAVRLFNRLAGTLRTLSLYKIIFEDASVTVSDVEENLLAKLLRHLAQPHLNMELISFGSLVQAVYSGAIQRHIKFAPFPGATYEQSKNNGEVDLTCDDKHRLVSNMVMKIVLEPLPEPESDSDESENQSSGEDEDEEMDGEE